MKNGAKAGKVRLVGQRGARGLLTRAEWTATWSALSLAAVAQGGPTGEQVVRGDVRFERRGNETLIYAGRNSIIRYRGFDIARGETVRFVQPDAGSRVLNRIDSAAPTRIDGNLFANGRVYLINPAGVYFGQGAVVDVAGLYAGAARMTDRDFLGNVNRFTGGTGAVVNEGRIEAGLVALVGGQVANLGAIVSPQGTVIMAAGRDVLVGPRGGNVQVRLTPGGTGAPASVTNAGTIEARGGRATMAAGDVLGAAMFNTGRISASSVRVEGVGASDVRVGGTIDATNARGAGGDVRILGRHVALEGAAIDASGAGGGGTIVVGGGVRASEETSVDAGSVLRADSTGDADAGRVTVWSDGTTRFDGRIEARAQGATGKGGRAEVSGKEHLAMGGHAYLGGQSGAGELLLDPGSVSIVDGPNTGPGGSLDVFNDAWVIDQLNTGGANLTISTTNSTNAATEDLSVAGAADISWNSAMGLTLVGNNSVTIAGTITNAGTGGLTLQGGSVAVNGAVSVGGAFASSGTSFASTAAIQSGAGVTLTHTGTVGVGANVTAATGFASVNAGAGGTFTSTGFTIDAGTGDVAITHAGDSVDLGALTTTGAVAVTGSGVTQAGTANVGSYDITATGLVTVGGAITATRAAGFSASGDGFTSSAGITASNASGRIQVNSSAGNIAVGGLLQSGAGGITLNAFSGGQITQGAGATASNGGQYTARAGGQFTLGASVAASQASIRGGADGTGNVVLGAGTISADSISLRAGDGVGGGGDAALVDLTGNPTFRDLGGTTHPGTFTLRQDASLADAGIPALARFQGGDVGGMFYVLQSDAGAVTLSTGAKVANTNLTLSGLTGVSIGTDLVLPSLHVSGPTTLSGDVNAGNGTVVFNGAVALGSATRSINGGDVTLAGGASSTGGGLFIAESGSLTIGGAVVLTGAGDFVQVGSGTLTLNAGISTQNRPISIAAPVVVGASVELNAGSSNLGLGSSVGIGAHALTLTGDGIDLAGGAGSVTGGGGLLVLQAFTNSLSIGVNGGPGALQISINDLNAIGAGLGGLIIGRDGGTHAIDVGGGTFAQETMFRANGAGGTINVSGDTAGIGPATFNFHGATTLNADVVTSGRGILFAGDVVLGAARPGYLVSTTGGATASGAGITFGGTINGATAGTRSLNLDAGTGGDIVAGAIGGGQALDQLRVTGAHDVTTGALSLDGLAQYAGTGLTTLGAISAGSAVSLTGNAFALGAVTGTGGFGMLLNNSGAATLGGVIDLQGPFLQTGGGAVSLGANISTSGDEIRLTAPVTLTGDAIVASHGGAVNVLGSVDGLHVLTLDSGTGTLTVSSDIGSIAHLASAHLAGGDVNLNAAVRALSVSVLGAGDVRVGADIGAASSIALQAGTDGSGNLSFSAPGVRLAAAAITLWAGDGSGTSATVDALTNAPQFLGSAGFGTSPLAFTFRQDAGVTSANLPQLSQFDGGIAGLDYSIESTGAGVAIDDATRVIGSDLSLEAFTGVDIQQGLDVASFRSGATVNLGANISAWNGDITLTGPLNVVGGGQTLFAYTGAVALGAVNAGANDLVVTADTVALNGALAGTGLLAIQPSAASRDVRLGGAGGAGFDLSGAELARISDGWSRVVLGRDDGTGLATSVGDLSFNDPVELRMGGAGGRFVAGGRLLGAGDASLRVQAGQSITLVGDVVTSGAFVRFDGAVVLGGSLRVDTTNAGLALDGANVDFSGTVDADVLLGARALTVDAGTNGMVRYHQGVGQTLALESLTSTGAANQLLSVRTNGAQTYNGLAVLGETLHVLGLADLLFHGNVQLVGDSVVHAGGNVRVDGTIDSLTTGLERSLDVGSDSGEVVLGGAVGLTHALQDLAVGSAAIRSAGVRAMGTVRYQGPVVLSGDVQGDTVIFQGDLTSTQNVTVTGGAHVVFAGGVGSETGAARELTVVSPETVFYGDIGSTPTGELGRLSTSGPTFFYGQTVHTTGAQSYGGRVGLFNDVTFRADAGGVTFAGNLDADSTPRTLIVNTPGETFFGGSVGSTGILASITTAGGGSSRFGGGTIRTSAAQDFSGAVRLDGATIFTGNSLSFASTIDSGSAGAQNLTVTSGGGPITFGGAVGATAAVGTVSVTASSFTLPSVRSTGGQTYNGPTRLTGNLTSTQSGTIAINGAATLAGNVSVTSAGASTDHVTFAGAVDAVDDPHSLTISAGQGRVTFGSNVGVGTAADVRAMSGLTASGGAIDLNQVQTTGSQIYSGATTLRGNLTSTGAGSIAVDGAAILGTNLTVTTASGAVVFGGTVDSDSTARSLTVNTGGGAQKRFGGAIGNTSRLTSLTINSDGSTRIEGGSVRTTGTQAYNSAVTVANHVTFEGPTISFLSTLDSDLLSSPRNVIVNTAGGTGAGTVTFGGGVGSAFRLGSLQVAGTGTSRVGGNVTTTRGVDFGGPVKLLASAVMDAGAGSMIFRGTIDTDANLAPANLTLRSTRGADVDRTPFLFGGNIGSSNALASLVVGGDLGTTPRAATIVFSDGLNPDGKVLASSFAATDLFTITTSGNFTMGLGQKLLAFGRLRITAGGTATLGDLVALADMQVTSGDIRLRLRPGGAIFDNAFQSPDQLLADPGLHFVAAGDINFSSVPTQTGSGNVPIFANNTGSGNANLSAFVFRRLSNAMGTSFFADTRTGGSLFLLPLDLRPTGRSPTDIATSLAGALPRDVTPGQAGSPPPISGTLQSSLAEMGIQTRGLSVEETIEFLAGRGVADDMRPRSGLAAGDYRVSTNRLSSAAASRAVASYRAFMVQTGISETTGQPVARDRSADIREHLGKAWEAYRGRATGPSGVGLRAYLEARGTGASTSEVAALKELNSARRVLTDIRAIGLSEYEASIPRRKLLDAIRPQGMAEKDLVEAVFGAPVAGGS